MRINKPARRQVPRGRRVVLDAVLSGATAAEDDRLAAGQRQRRRGGCGRAPLRNAERSSELAGGTAAFLAQLFAQDEPVEEQPDPFADASRAYERFREERDTSLFVDARDPIDVKV